MVANVRASLEEKLDDLIEGFPGNAEAIIQLAPQLREEFTRIDDQQRIEKCIVWEIFAHYHLWHKETVYSLLDAWEPIAEERDWHYAKIKFLNLRGILARRMG